MKVRRVQQSDNGSGDEGAVRLAPVALDPRPEQRSHRPSLAALLTEAEVVTDAQVKEALEEGLRTGEKLGEVLVRRGWATEDQLARLLAEQWDLPFSSADLLAIDPTAVRQLKGSQARQIGALPVWYERIGRQVAEQGYERRLMVAIAEPSDERFAAVREAIEDHEIGYVVVARSALERLLHSRLTSSDEGEEAVPAVAAAEAVVDDNVDSSEQSEVAPVAYMPHVAQPAPEAPEADAPADSPVDTPVAAPVVAIVPAGTASERGETGEVVVPSFGTVIGALENTATELRSIQTQLDELGADLGRTRVRLAEQERRTEAAEAAHKTAEAAQKTAEASLRTAEASNRTAQERIRDLEAKLSQRGDVLKGLKTKVAELGATLDSTGL